MKRLSHSDLCSNDKHNTHTWIFPMKRCHRSVMNCLLFYKNTYIFFFASVELWFWMKGMRWGIMEWLGRRNEWKNIFLYMSNVIFAPEIFNGNKSRQLNNNNRKITKSSTESNNNKSKKIKLYKVEGGKIIAKSSKDAKDGFCLHNVFQLKYFFLGIKKNV